jgi:hypothetical protein
VTVKISPFDQNFIGILLGTAPIAGTCRADDLKVSHADSVLKVGGLHRKRAAGGERLADRVGLEMHEH